MKTFLGIAVLGIAFATAGCEPKGPAERAGEQLDQAVGDVRDTADDIGDKAQEVADDVADKLEQPDAKKP